MEEWGRFEPVTVKKWLGEHTIHVPMPRVDDIGAGALDNQLIAEICMAARGGNQTLKRMS
ncbi:MAG TPA: hypothetical protein VD738_08205 [Nitrospira sp.]|nr:hypothetical protein [Nitrospira sp.]